MGTENDNSTYYGAIDIGSNAVRLIVKRLEDREVGTFSKCVTMRVPLRLGQEVFTEGRISESKARQLVKLIRAYKIVMKLYGVKKRAFRCCATSAMREAENGGAVADAVAAATGIHVDIIDGAEEASIICRQCKQSTSDANKVYVDVGGGSTDISFVPKMETVRSTHSYPVGTVRMINGLDTAPAMARMRADMAAIADLYDGVVIVGTGGNINKLYSLAEGSSATEQTMTVSALRALHAELSDLSPEARAERYNLKPDRADVIVPAAEIYLNVASALGATYIEVPTVGLADGIINALYEDERRNRHRRRQK